MKNESRKERRMKGKEDGGRGREEKEKEIGGERRKNGEEEEEEEGRERGRGEKRKRRRRQREEEKEGAEVEEEKEEVEEDKRRRRERVHEVLRQNLFSPRYKPCRKSLRQRTGQSLSTHLTLRLDVSQNMGKKDKDTSPYHAWEFKM